MAPAGKTASGTALESLTYSELIDLWAENEIARRLQEVEYFHAEIIRAAFRLERLQVMPMRGGFRDRRRTVEVLVEVRDRHQRRSRIGAWEEKKSGRNDSVAIQRAYDKAMAHAIIQLLPAAVWRPWLGAAAHR